MAKLLEEFKRELRLELRTLKESVKYCSDTCDGVNEIQKDMKELRLDIKRLIERNNELEKENQYLRERLDELEQCQRLNNLEIKGLPADCDVLEIVKEIGKKLAEQIVDADIDICHKVDIPRSKDKNVIVLFTRRSKRNLVLAKARKMRLTTDALGFEGASKPVFLTRKNKRLTRKNKQLLGAAVAKKKSVAWKYVWTSNGKVRSRRGESTPILRITTMADIECMKAQSPAAALSK